jgi:hypothetical protein
MMKMIVATDVAAERYSGFKCRLRWYNIGASLTG